jgi:hypothetical protein
MGEQWYCKIVGQEVGPVTSEDLVSMLRRGQIDPTDPVRAGTSGPWRPVKEILGGAMPDDLGGVATVMAESGHERDGYGFLDDLARLEDTESDPAPVRRPASSRSSDHLLAGMADLEDADALDVIPSVPSVPSVPFVPSVPSGGSTQELLAGLADAGGSTQELLAGLADAEEPPRPQPQKPATPAPQRNAPPAASPAATLDMVQRLDAEYRRLRAQLTGGAPVESGSWHGQPMETGSWPGQPQWPGQPAAPVAYGAPGYPQAPPPPQHGWPPQYPGASVAPQGWVPPQAPVAPSPAAPQPPVPPSPPAAAVPPQPAAPPVKLPPPPSKAPEPSPVAEAPKPPASSGPPPLAAGATTPKAQFDAGSTTSAATDMLRDMGAAHIRAAQTAARPAARSPYSAPSKSSGGDGGLNFDLSSINLTGKPVIITAAVVGVLVLGYFGMSFGFLSGISAGPVYDEAKKYYKDFQTASTKGPEASEFTTFYTNWKKARPDMLKKLGNPSAGSTAYNVKQAVSTLGSRVESFKMKLDKADQEMYESSVKQKFDQLQKEFGR